MDALNLADYLYKKLRQRRNTGVFGTGNGSFDDYRYGWADKRFNVHGRRNQNSNEKYRVSR